MLLVQNALSSKHIDYKIQNALSLKHFEFETL
jgi:hypothetical protein